VVGLLVIGLPYGWLRIQTESITIVGRAGPVQPGDQVTVDIGDAVVGPMGFGFERAPLGRWFLSHEGSLRVQDHWYWPMPNGERSSNMPALFSPATVKVPADAHGNEIALCDIDNDCVLISLQAP